MKKFTFLKMMLLSVFMMGSVSMFGQYSGVGTFSKITSVADLTENYYVIVNSTDAFAMNNTYVSNTYLSGTAVTPSSNNIVNPGTNIVWKITPHADGGFTIYNEASSKYVSYTGSSNNVQIVDAVTAANQRWTAAYTSDLFRISNAGITARYLQYNATSPRFACYTGSQQYLQLYKLQPSSGTQAPTFSVGTGKYTTSQTVTLNSTTAGAKIYYTTDGTEPDNTRTLYAGTPITVATTTTIKAIAYDATDANPSAAVTATYTFPTLVANIGALRAGTVGGFYQLTGEVIITLITSTRNAKYIQDATGGILIDDNSGIITTAYNVNDGITGLIGELVSFNSMLQITPAINPGAASSTGNSVTPVEITISQLIDHQAQLVKVKNTSITETGNFASGTNYTITDASGTGVMRLQYSDLPLIGSAIPTVAQDIVGVVLTYNNTTHQLIPISMANFSTGIFSPKTESLNVSVKNGKIVFEAAQGETVEVFNAVGQKLLSQPTVDGKNELMISNKGVTVVRIANRVGKVML